ncbi:MAG: CAP domain-containing protein [Planctomycetes bacterium]|nr:CAP domain-containing protein [Planctomycetota bacterium]
MMLSLRVPRLLTACTVLALGGCFAPAGGAAEERDAEKPVDGAARCVVPDDEVTVADQVLQLINFERAEAELAPVALNPTLTAVAGDYACRMIEEGFFGHEDPVDGAGPGDRAASAKYTFYAVGENLAAGQESAADVVRVWMDSPSHREIILDERWQEVGIAVRRGGEHAVYWVQEFGDPSDF